MTHSKIDKDHVIAIATKDLKLASLLYDYIYRADVLEKEEDPPPDIIYHPDKIFARPGDQGNRIIHAKYNELIKPLIDTLAGKPENVSTLEKYEALMKVKSAQIDFTNTFVREVYMSLTSTGVRTVPLFYDHLYYDEYFGHGDNICLQIELFNYPIIDSSNIDWKHISEIRQKNKAFHKSIRDFRLFLLQNYEGKEADYIYDDLMKKTDRYQEDCTRYGLKLTLAKTKMLIDPRSYGATSILLSLNILAGNDLATGIAGLAGFMLDFGRIMIKTEQKKLEYKQEINNPELAYLVELKKLEKKE